MGMGPFSSSSSRRRKHGEDAGSDGSDASSPKSATSGQQGPTAQTAEASGFSILGQQEGQGSKMADDVDDFESFEESLTVRSLPIVVFDKGVKFQKVWEHGSVVKGEVQCDGKPDVVQESPAVMSPAFLGFAIEPYEKRYLHYDGVGMVFARPHRGSFMQPSIDTILMCLGLSKLFKPEDASDPVSISRCIDVGSGSGFIGKYAAAHAPEGEGALNMTLVDIDPAAMDFCRSPGFQRLPRSKRGREISWNLLAQDAIELIEKDPRYDLIVSNPPYIPTVEEARGVAPKRDVSGFWEGIGLVLYLIDLVINERCAPGAHLVLMVTSLTLKSPQVRERLAACPAKGVRVRVLEEREIAWKAWYAGPGGGGSNHLLATPADAKKRQKIGDCEYFVGATEPCKSRDPTSRSDKASRHFGYHWHYAYVLHIHRPVSARRSRPESASTQLKVVE